MKEPTNTTNKPEKTGNKTAVLFTVFFLIIIFGFGILSFANLTGYYINDETVNNEWTAEMGNKLETDISSTFFRKFSFVNLNGAVRRFFRQQEMNGVVKLNNGYLTEPLAICPDESIRDYVHRTESFNTYLKNRGTALLYVSPPYTSSKWDPELPAGIEDYSNDNIDRLLASLRAAGIDTLDFRETMAADGIDHYSMMYKTDHHWTTEAGFYAYRYLEKYIAEKTGCEIDPRVADLANYTVTKFDKWHLGSRGQRTGVYYTGIDDFVLIDPNFETIVEDPYGVTNPIHKYFFITEYLEERDLTSRYTYDSVLGGPAYLGHYKNPNSRNDVRILMITDSFAKAVNPYLIMQFAEVNTFYNGSVTNITPQLIEEYDPDVVIMLYYPHYINQNSGSFDFNFTDK